MTQKTWEKQLSRRLKDLPKTERKQVLDYYREIYGDKLEAGFSETEILDEFGSPEECATRILAGEGITPTKAERKNPRLSPAAIVGMFFLSLIFILPLAIVALSLVITFFALTVSGVGIALAGVVYAIGAPLLSIGSLSAAGIFAHLGFGLALCGVGLLLFAAFKPLTEYVAIGTGKTLAFLYKGRFF
ncbi:MAG: DUF1700 domain-containing protein [Clostridia bacterium]|nr:DUF1700 domain-containing protein [Clostridia bacterium]